MSDKVLVEVFVPSVGKRYDIHVPVKQPLHQIIILVASALSELTGGKFAVGRDAVLCDKETGAAFDINMTVQELCLHNGSQLMLI